MSNSHGQGCRDGCGGQPGVMVWRGPRSGLAEQEWVCHWGHLLQERARWGGGGMSVYAEPHLARRGKGCPLARWLAGPASQPSDPGLWNKAGSLCARWVLPHQGRGAGGQGTLIFASPELVPPVAIRSHGGGARPASQQPWLCSGMGNARSRQKPKSFNFASLI